MNKPTFTTSKDRTIVNRKQAKGRVHAVVLAVLLALTCPLLAHAVPAVDFAWVECSLQSTRLGFGTLARGNSPSIRGEGEVVMACQNLSQDVRSVGISVGFPSMGSHTALLQASHGALAVDFFLDAQLTEHWGNGSNGSSACQVLVKLGPGEYRLLRLPVYALLQNRRDASAGNYLVHVPLQMTTTQR